MIRNLVFDIGNVLVDWNPVPHLNKWANSPEEATLLKTIVFDGPEFKNGDKGLFTREDTKQALLQRYPEYAQQIQRALAECDDYLTINAGNTDLLKELKAAGFRLYFLSNTNPSAFEYMTSRYEVFALMDGGVASFKCGFLKPGEEIFLHFLEKFQLKAEECVFCDDMPENTAGAAACGFHTVTLHDINQLREELMKYEDVRNAMSKLEV